MEKVRVGQKVRVSQNPIWPDDSPVFVSGMDKWKGKVVTIAQIIGKDRYRIEEDGGDWKWSARWFEPVAEEIIELKDKTATVYNVYEKDGQTVREPDRDVKIKDLFRKVISSGSTITPLLPAGTRFFQHNGEKDIIVVENPPQVRSISLSNIDDVDGTDSLRLAFPYTIFVIIFRRGHLEKVHFFYRNAPLTSLDDVIYYANLPNIDKGAKVCMNKPDFPEEFSLADKVNKVIEEFWQSQFNRDLKHNYYWAKDVDERVNGFYKWHKSSSKDQLFMLEISWRLFGNLRKFLEEHQATLPASEADVADIIYQI